MKSRNRTASADAWPYSTRVAVHAQLDDVLRHGVGVVARAAAGERERERVDAQAVGQQQDAAHGHGGRQLRDP